MGSSRLLLVHAAALSSHVLLEDLLAIGQHVCHAFKTAKISPAEFRDRHHGESFGRRRQRVP